MTSRRQAPRLLAAAFVAAALVSVGLLLWGQWTSLDEILASTRSFDWTFHPGWIGLAVAVAVANLFLMGSVWAFLFSRTGGATRGRDAVRVWVITNFGRYIPGKVWQLGGLAVYMRGRGDSGAAALTSALAFQIMTLVTGAAVAVSTIGGRWVAGGAGWLPAVVALGALLLAGLHPSVIRWIARRLAGWLGEADLRLDLAARDIVRSAAGLLAAWLLYGTGLLLLLAGIGVSVELSQIWVLTGIFAAAYVVGYLVVVAPGGLVVREGALTALLAEMIGLVVGVAAAAAILARLWVVVSELLALILVLALPRVPEEEEERSG